MSKQSRKHRLALLFLVAVVIFCVQFITIAVAGGITYLLVHMGVLYSDGGSASTRWLILYMIIIGNIVGMVSAFLGSRFSLTPLNYLIQQMNQLASGNFKVRLHFKPPLGEFTTFSTLSDSFNKMAEELENTEMLRSDFVNNFSHEFKTPIVSIAGFAKLLRHRNLSEEEAVEYLAVIEEESLRLSSMASNVLELTKVENQTILREVSEYNLSEQIRACILLLEDKWAKKGINFDLNFEEHTICASEDLLKQVWSNLIDNAIKFSPEGGTVEIHIRRNTSSIAVSILNTGEEIAPENQKRIFNKFYQADSSHSSEGNGIGLAIVKQIVSLHKGAVSVQSADHRTTFTVELPVG